MKVPPMIEAKVTNSLQGSILTLIQRDYQFITGEKIQNLFVSDLVDLVEKCYREPWQLDVGQIMWFGVKIPEKPNYGQNSKNTPLTPVVLTLISKDDIDMKNAGCSGKEIKEAKIVRLFKEAYKQGTLITHDDVAFLLHTTTLTISRYVRDYMKRTGEVLPTRGIIHDIGCAITHKKIILKLYKNGYQTPDISRMTNHTEQACDRYIKAYKKVEKLSKTMNSDEIAQVLEMSRSLVEEYINILNEEED